MSAPCPYCGHADEDHRRESWFDEEGVEGMTCMECEDSLRPCKWMTHDWSEVVAGTAMDWDHEPSTPGRSSDGVG